VVCLCFGAAGFGHRGELVASVTSVDGQMSPSWFRVVLPHTYVVLLVDVPPILTGPRTIPKSQMSTLAVGLLL